MTILFKIFRDLLRYFKYDHGEDPVLKQERFEPAEWTLPIKEQISLLEEKYLAGIKVDNVYYEKTITHRLNKGFVRVAIPKISFLGKMNNTSNPYHEIGILIEQVCELLSVQREGKFTHYRKGQLGLNRIQCIQTIIDKRKHIEEQIPGDILILDVNLGNNYAGWTPRLARESILRSKNEIALFAVDIAWILLLNPNRLQSNTDLSIDSVAEDYLSEDRGWVTNLFFYYRGGKLEFGYRWNRRAYFDCGAAIAYFKNKFIL